MGFQRDRVLLKPVAPASENRSMGAFKTPRFNVAGKKEKDAGYLRRKAHKMCLITIRSGFHNSQAICASILRCYMTENISIITRCRIRETGL